MVAGVQVTLNFNSMDEAILALGKLAVAATAPKALSPAPIKPQAEAATAIPSSAKPRKPRNDAGKPRGSYKEPAAPDALATSAGDAAPVAPVAADPKSSALSEFVRNADPKTKAAVMDEVLQKAIDKQNEVIAVSKPISDADIQSAIQALHDAKGLAVTLAVFSRFGVKVGRELKQEQRADFIAKALAVIDGEEV